MMAGYPRTEKSHCDDCGEYGTVRKVRVDLGAVSNVKRYLCEDCR